MAASSAIRAARTREPASHLGVTSLIALVAGGACIATSFLDPSLWPLAWVGPVPLLYVATRCASRRSAMFAGMVMGLAINVPAFSWLIYTITRFGGFPVAIAVFFYAVLSCWGALQFGLLGIALRIVGPQSSSLVLASAWTAAEFLFPNLFPWRLGHSQRELLPLLQIGEITGPYGLTFVMVWAGAAALQARRRPAMAAAAFGAVALLWVSGTARLQTIEQHLAQSDSLRVALIQGNVGLDEKRHANLFDSNVARYRTLSKRFRPPLDLIVWPETVVEWGIPHDDSELGTRDPFPDATTALLFGAVTYRETPGQARPDFFNTALIRQPDGRIAGRYDKVVLMPFGEFLPLGNLFPWLYDLSPATGNFRAGDGPVVIPAGPRMRVAPLICYEDLLATHARRAVGLGANLLVTIANDAWFGQSRALWMHESLALWRAIENRRPLLRATNTGLSGIISASGRVQGNLAPDQEVAEAFDVRSLELTTIYTQWGDWFGWLVTVWVGAVLLRRRAVPVQS